MLTVELPNLERAKLFMERLQNKHGFGKAQRACELRMLMQPTRPCPMMAPTHTAAPQPCALDRLDGCQPGLL